MLDVRQYELKTREVKYIDRKLTKEDMVKLLEKLLNSVYDRVSSRFLHDGKLIPLGSVGADRPGLAYLRDASNPGYGWFKRVARESLISFLDRGGTGGHIDLHSLLVREHQLRIRARRNIVRGQVLAVDDVYLQERE